MQSKGPTVHAFHSTLSSIRARIIGHPIHCHPRRTPRAWKYPISSRAPKYTSGLQVVPRLTGIDIVLTLRSSAHSSVGFVCPTQYFILLPRPNIHTTVRSHAMGIQQNERSTISLITYTLRCRPSHSPFHLAVRLRTTYTSHRVLYPSIDYSGVLETLHKEGKYLPQREGCSSRPLAGG